MFEAPDGPPDNHSAVISRQCSRTCKGEGQS